MSHPHCHHTVSSGIVAAANPAPPISANSNPTPDDDIHDQEKCEDALLINWALEMPLAMKEVSVVANQDHDPSPPLPWVGHESTTRLSFPATGVRHADVDHIFTTVM